MNDQQIEQEILAKGLNVAPRVTKEQIDSLMEHVVYRFDQPEGTTSTMAHAFLNGDFLLATGHSACVSRENVCAESGRKWAQAKAEELARDKLWELEGYALRKSMQPKPGYTAGDVKEIRTEEDLCAGQAKFRVQMKDGQMFVGAVPLEGASKSAAAQTILAECNRMGASQKQ